MLLSLQDVGLWDLAVHGALMECLMSVPWGRIPELTAMVDNTTEQGKNLLKVSEDMQEQVMMMGRGAFFFLHLMR